MPLLPHFPVISTVEPHVIYLTVHNYNYNRKCEGWEVAELYVLGVDMHLRSVVSAFKASSSRMLTSHCTRYLNQVLLPNRSLTFFLAKTDVIKLN